MSGAVDGTQQVDLEYPRGLAERPDVRGGRLRIHSRGRAKDVRRTELLLDPGERGVHHVPVCDIHRDRDASPAGGLDRRASLDQTALVDVQRSDPRPLRGEADRRGSALA